MDPQTITTIAPSPVTTESPHGACAAQVGPYESAYFFLAKETDNVYRQNRILTGVLGGVLGLVGLAVLLLFARHLRQKRARARGVGDVPVCCCGTPACHAKMGPAESVYEKEKL